MCWHSSRFLCTLESQQVALTAYLSHFVQALDSQQKKADDYKIEDICVMAIKVCFAECKRIRFALAAPPFSY